ncbi:MAG: alpha-amylase family glycosyl hydrolase [Saccharofermentanales bacterium]
MKKLISLLVVAAITITIACSIGIPVNTAAEAAYLDNSDVMPLYVDDQDVALEDSGDGIMSPDWVKTLFIAEITVARCTEEGTFDSAVAVLDHYQEMGVNGLWLTPIFDSSQNTGGHYGNYGIYTISPTLTGTTDYTLGFQELKDFVDAAHARNIRIFLDVVTWGVITDAPLYNEHPDWFKGASYWGGWDYDWTNADLKEWFISQMVWLATDIGVDGFRADLEPGVTGYDVYQEIRDRALAAGQKIAVYSESTNERLGGAFDFDEHSVNGDDMWNIDELFTQRYNIVDTVKTGVGIGTTFLQLTDESAKSRFYSFLVSCHDQPYTIEGDLVKFGYQAIFSPFIPIFFMGEEFNNPMTVDVTTFLNPLQLDMLDQIENRNFFEEVKQLIRVRRLYSDIFEYFPQQLRDSNICKMEIVGLETLQGYARFDDEQAVLIVPNNNVHTEGPFTVRVPYSELGFEDGNYKITDIITGEIIAAGNFITLYDFQANVAQNRIGLYVLSKADAVVTTLAPE